jgi:hypothetical protein
MKKVKILTTSDIIDGLCIASQRILDGEDVPINDESRLGEILSDIKGLEYVFTFCSKKNSKFFITKKIRTLKKHVSSKL